MTTFVDYNQLQDDFKTAVEGGSLGFKTVLEDANLRDFLFDNMPLLDIRVKGGRSAGHYEQDLLCPDCHRMRDFGLFLGFSP
jgi:hypothetical protein